MAQSDDGLRLAAGAMGRLTAASQALYMAHLTAIKAGQQPPPDHIEILQAEVVAAAASLVDICDVPDVSMSDLMSDLLSE